MKLTSREKYFLLASLNNYIEETEHQEFNGLVTLAEETTVTNVLDSLFDKVALEDTSDTDVKYDPMSDKLMAYRGFEP